MDFITLKCRFTGYCDKSSSYRFFDKWKGSIEYRYATFLEHLVEDESNKEKNEPLCIIGDGPEVRKELQLEIETKPTPMDETLNKLPAIVNKLELH